MNKNILKNEIIKSGKGYYILEPSTNNDGYINSLYLLPVIAFSIDSIIDPVTETTEITFIHPILAPPDVRGFSNKNNRYTIVYPNGSVESSDETDLYDSIEEYIVDKFKVNKDSIVKLSNKYTFDSLVKDEFDEFVI